MKIKISTVSFTSPPSNPKFLILISISLASFWHISSGYRFTRTYALGTSLGLEVKTKKLPLEGNLLQILRGGRTIGRSNRQKTLHPWLTPLHSCHQPWKCGAQADSCSCIIGINPRPHTGAPLEVERRRPLNLGRLNFACQRMRPGQRAASDMNSSAPRPICSYILVQTHIWNNCKTIAKITFLLSNYLVISD